MEALLRGATRLPREFRSREHLLDPATVCEVLDPFLSDERRERIERVVSERCGSVAVVVDGLANSGNVAAVMRTAEGLGFLNFHVIQRQLPYKHSRRTTQGTDKWLDVHVWDGPAECVRVARAAGMRIVAAHLDRRSRPLDDFDFTIPTALVFGNELGGVSEDLLEMADATCIIPMTGFAQSFNISVAAATCLYHARSDRMRRQGRHGDLGLADQAWLRAAYTYLSVQAAQPILDRGA